MTTAEVVACRICARNVAPDELAKNQRYCKRCAAEYARNYYYKYRDIIRAKVKAKRATGAFAAWERENYKRNKAKVLARTKKYREAHKEQFAEYNRKWRAANRERLNAQSRAAYLETPVRFAKNRKKWEAKNPEKLRAKVRNRRARLAGVPGVHTASDISIIRKAQKNRCAVCDASLGRRGEVDHIRPIVRGGSNDPANLQLLCKTCNSSKGARDPLLFMRERGMLL